MTGIWIDEEGALHIEGCEILKPIDVSTLNGAEVVEMGLRIITTPKKSHYVKIIGR